LSVVGAVDTSVVVAAFASWHEDHALAVRTLAGGPDLLAPVALETYAVLTRLPPPHRAEAAIVRDFLARAFPRQWLTLPEDAWRRVIDDLGGLGVTGGASYDAVIGMTAVHHGRELLTLDLRARRTYELVGLRTRFLG
jgi:predicted nucleic acid-binding protein